MVPVKLNDKTRSLAPPKNWDDTAGECMTLDIHDAQGLNGNVMISAWIPDEEELQKLKNGSIIYLQIHGKTHPVVSLSIQ